MCDIEQDLNVFEHIRGKLSISITIRIQNHLNYGINRRSNNRLEFY
jgi:hypothetical protein